MSIIIEISEKLQAFVALDSHPFGLQLIGVGGVGQCVLQQCNILKAVAQSGFQILNHRYSPCRSEAAGLLPVP